MNDKIHALINITRVNKPVPIILLLWPCIWALMLADESVSWLIYINFIIGSILMRAAGCILNDIFDREFDKNVARTKDRPLAANKLKIYEALILFIILCLLSLFLSLWILPLKTIFICISWSLLIILYPFAKRFTYFPQYVLGITFNGVIIAFSSVNEINFQAILLYIATIFWICGYDSIYAISDYEDDIKIGVKSPVIIFKDNIIYFIAFNYFIFISIFAYITQSLWIITLIIHLFWQLWQISTHCDYQYIFKSNIIAGFLALLCLF